jgi:polyprenyl-phospho-N-acetylgalactosaminyl synthase
MKLIAVIPAYNEESMIAEVIDSVRPHVDEVVVVDDGSQDKTYLQAKSAQAIVTKHLINRGQGAALQTGMDLALKRGADIIVHFDSDGQHPSHQIADLVRPVQEDKADIVMGSRFLDTTSNVPKTRRVILKLGALFTRIMSGLSITDPHSGFRALNRKAASKIRLRQDRMAHASELLQLVSRHELRHKEIPVTIRYTDYSMAKGQSSWNAIKIVIDLIKGSML